MPPSVSDQATAVAAREMPAALPILLVLPATPMSAATARSVVSTALRPVLPHDVLADVELLSTELVANAVAASSEQCTVAVTAPESDVVRVSVSDFSAQPPSVHAAESSAEHGRGLSLVDVLSWRWGFEPNEPHGKTVWFEVRAITR